MPVWSGSAVETATYDYPWLINVTAICAVVTS